MTQEKLMENLRQHEANCSGRPAVFTIVDTRELADGIIGFVDDTGEYALFFDKEKHAAAPDSPFADIGEEIEGFPENSGLILNVQARSWEAIAETIALSLQPVGT